jgi:hypothetical protein
MKFIKYIYLLATIFPAALFTFSCESEKFLEEESRSEVTSDMLFNSMEGVDYFMNGLYAMVYIEHDRGNAVETYGEQMLGTQMHCGVDNVAVHAHDGTSLMSPLGEWQFVIPEWAHNRRTFEWVFRVINNANTVISRIDNPEIKWTEEAKNQVLAEARTIRAWGYRHATYLYGEVPLIDQEVKEVKTDWIRTDLPTLYEFMEQDLLYAEANLAKFHPHPGKISRAVATHYLAELYLRMERWQDALDATNRVINDPDYELITDRYGVRLNEPGVAFMDQFYDGNVKRSEGNTEVLWAWIYEPGVISESRGSYLNRYWYHRLYQVNFMGSEAKAQFGAQSLSRYAITPYGFNVYEPQDDRYSEYAITHYFVALRSGFDLRGTPAIVSPGDTVMTTWFHPTLPKTQPTNENRDFMWSSTRKWEDRDPNYAVTTRGWTYGDQVYLRLAETYLIKAEAQFRLSQPAEAANTLNIIRARSNATPISAGDVDLGFILDERSRELLGEEQRRYTLVRTGTFVERYKQYNPLNPETVQPHHALFPIPQTVIDANVDLKMPNNPGYE